MNDKQISTSLSPGITLLDFIRYHKSLTGTKIGCREGDCGACTVLVGIIREDKMYYESKTSCLMPLGNASGKHVVTIEGINIEGFTAVQEAFANEGATQCGFCTPGFIVSLTGFCLDANEPLYEGAIDSMNGNICRCTGYKSIQRAASNISSQMHQRKKEDAIDYAVRNKMIPAYFHSIQQRLGELPAPVNHSQQNQSGLKKVAGGTDLYVQQHDTIVNQPINFLIADPTFKGIQKNGERCEMGGSVTASDLAKSFIFQEHFGNLKKYIGLVSSTQIRNMATLAGNFTNASPIGDFTVFFLALNTELLLNDGNSTRTIRLRDLYKGYKLLDKKEDEIIEKISFKLPQKTDLFNFEKISKRTNLDIASVNTALFLQMNGNVIGGAGLSAGGVGPIPAYMVKSSEFLIGKEVEASLITELNEIVQSEITPISDARGTAAYKRLLLSQLIKAHFIQLFPLLPLEKILYA